MKRVGAAVVALVAVLFSVGFAGRPAHAKIEPPPLTVPPLPAPVTSTLGLAGPVLTAECGTFITALTLVVPMLGGSLPIDPIPLLAGVIEVCGSIPQPKPALHCGVDTTVGQELANLLGSLKILLAIVNTQLAAPVAEELNVVQGAVPSALLVANVAQLAGQLLQCNAGAPASPPPTGASVSPPVSPSLAEPVSPPALLLPQVTAPGSTPAVTAPANVPASTAAPSQAAAAPPLAAPSLVVASVPSGATPVGSAVIGFVFMLVAGLGMAVKLRSRP